MEVKIREDYRLWNSTIRVGGERATVQKIIKDKTDLKGKYSSLNKYTFDIEANPCIYLCFLQNSPENKIYLKSVSNKTRKEIVMDKQVFR